MSKPASTSFENNLRISDTALRSLYWIAVACLVVCCLGWTVISFWFDPFCETGAVANTQRPFLVFFALALLGCVAYLVTVWQAVTKSFQFGLKEIIGISVLCRVLLLPSIPIQEIDLYRYLWDGYVTNAGISPYRYSPEEIKRAIKKQTAPPFSADSPPLPAMLNQKDEQNSQQFGQPENPEVATLVQLCKQKPEVHRILDLVHFSELPTVYPPVSQAVFAISVLTTPQNTSRYVRILVLKFWLMLFDIATLFGVLAIIKQLKIAQNWAVVYGYSPLVFKEFANGGHLDTITVCCTVWSVLFLLKAVAFSKSTEKLNRKSSIWNLIFSAILFAASIAGKLYPVLLTPVLGIFLLKRLGFVKSGTWLAVSVLAALIFLSPWIFSGSSRAQGNANSQVEPTDGLQAFVTHWKINDWAFSFVFDNILPDSQRERVGKNKITPWYVFVPANWRENLRETVKNIGQVDSEPDKPAVISSFLLTRIITLAIWLLILVFLLRSVWRNPTAQNLVHQTFLTLAWFWILAPTQNPWYWTWAIPFLLPTHRKAWLGMGCVVFAYYLRFPLMYFETDGFVLGTQFSSWEFFNDIIVWLEFAPIMLGILFFKNQTKTNQP